MVAARVRVHCPAQITTFSHWIVPSAVSTPVIRPFSTRIRVTSVSSKIFTPAIRAPLARLWVMSEGLACPSVGRKAAPTRSPISMIGHRSCALFRGQKMHLQTERMGRGGLPLHLGPALGIAGEAKAAVHLPAGLKAGFLGELFVKLDRIAQQLRDVGRSAQLPDQSCRVKGRPACQLLALQQNRVGPTQFAEVIGDRTADDPAADDDSFGKYLAAWDPQVWRQASSAAR